MSPICWHASNVCQVRLTHRLGFRWTFSGHPARLRRRFQQIRRRGGEAHEQDREDAGCGGPERQLVAPADARDAREEGGWRRKQQEAEESLCPGKRAGSRDSVVDMCRRHLGSPPTSVLDDSDGDRCWFPSCFLLLYPASRQCCFRTRADSSCDWLPVPLPDPTTGLGPMVKKSTKAEACCVSLP